MLQLVLGTSISDRGFGIQPLVIAGLNSAIHRHRSTCIDATGSSPGMTMSRVFAMRKPDDAALFVGAGRNRPSEMAGVEDPVEQVLMVLCGVTLAGFSTDRLLRRRDAHPRSSVAVAARSHDDLLCLWRVHRRSGGDKAQ